MARIRRVVTIVLLATQATTGLAAALSKHDRQKQPSASDTVELDSSVTEVDAIDSCFMNPIPEKKDSSSSSKAPAASATSQHKTKAKPTAAAGKKEKEKQKQKQEQNLQDFMVAKPSDGPIVKTGSKDYTLIKSNKQDDKKDDDKSKDPPAKDPPDSSKAITNENLSSEDPDPSDPFGFLTDGTHPWHGERPDFDGKWTNDDSDVIWQFLAGDADPPDHALNTIRAVLRKEFEYYDITEPVHGALPPPGWPWLPTEPLFGNEKVSVTRPGSFWTQMKAWPYSDDWTRYMNFNRTEDDEGRKRDVADERGMSKTVSKSNATESGELEDEYEHIKSTKILKREDKEPYTGIQKDTGKKEQKEKPTKTPNEQQHKEQDTPKADWPTQDPQGPETDFSPNTEEQQKAWEAMADQRKSSGSNKDSKINTDGYALLNPSKDNYGHIPEFSYPRPAPEVPKVSDVPWPHDPNKPPTHPPATFKEQEDAVRRRLFQTTLNRTEYEARNWNWLRCDNRSPNTRTMPMTIEAGGLWATQDDYFRHRLKKRLKYMTCQLNGHRWDRAVQIKHWNGQDWGDMTITIYFETYRENYWYKNGGCSFEENILKPALDVMKKKFNQGKERRVLYVHGCGGPWGKDWQYNDLVVQVPNEVVYENPPAKDMERFKGVENLPIGLSPPMHIETNMYGYPPP